MKLRLTKRQLAQIISEAHGFATDIEPFSLGEPPLDPDLESRGLELEAIIKRLATKGRLTPEEKIELADAEQEYADLMGW